MGTITSSADSELFDDSDELITYQEAAEMLEAPYWQVTDATHNGALRPVRRPGDRRKYLRRIDVLNYAELQTRSKPHLVQELLVLRRERARMPIAPIPPASPTGRRHPRTPSSTARAASESAPSPVAPLRRELLAFLDKLDADQEASIRRKSMRLPPGVEPPLENPWTVLLDLLGRGGRAVYRSKLQTDQGVLEVWDYVVRVGEQYPEIRKCVEQIQQSALNPPSGEPVDPRQIPLPEVVTGSASHRARRKGAA